MKTTGLVAALGLAAAAFALPAQAQWYAGGGFGQSSFKDELGCSGAGAGISCDDKDTAWKAFAGYQVNRNFAAELTYQDFGKAKASDGVDSASVKSNVFDISGLGMLPFANQFAGYARLGIFFARTDFDSTFIGGSSQSNSGLTYGLGLQWDPMPKLGVRVEWQIYNDVGGGDIGKGDIQVLGLSALYRF
jgi:OOP family OmpA-OmpF porin